MAEIQNPLTAPLPAEVPLPDAPLVRVIGQVRFPPVLSLEKREFIAPFQEAIRSTYPVLRPEQTQGIVLGPQGVAPGPKQIAWRFSDVDG
ncbi:MAG TPA: TIGR04255 family protein, partial [Polyangiaceae bacterium]|nr:TIGR04255 family protein [Polyangiaceae bacterium]